MYCTLDMSEPRRLHFTTIGPVGKERGRRAPPTIRFTLALRESTDKICPEFSFADLMKNALGESCECSKEASKDTEQLEEEAENQRLTEIARAFEEKYGPKPGRKRSKRLDHIQDLVDLGEGYDETDPFVDNSEAYDELVPACLTTKLGGFYINSGMLDFRELSDDSNSEFRDTPLKKKKKSKKITSDTESEGEMKKKTQKKRKLKDGSGKDRKRKLNVLDGEREFKKPKKPLDKERLRKKKSSSTVKELLKQQTVSTSNATSNGNAHELSPSVSPVTSHNNMDDAVDAGMGDASKIESTIESVINQAINNMREDSNSREKEEERKTPLDPESIPKLCFGIPEALENLIEKLKHAARESVEGKCKFFTNDINKMLLDIEVESRQLNGLQRSSIYAHLAAFLPCSKDTLLKRAKKLVRNQQDDKLREPIQRLKEAIITMMPAQMERYQALLQESSQQVVEDKLESKEDVSSESEDDKGSADNEKKKFIPKKKFEWNENIRSLLCDIVKLKMQCYGMSKIRAQSAEDYLNAFLETELKPLWAKGWMQRRILFKESKMAHDSWTNMPPIRPKKTILPSKPEGFSSAPPTISATVVTTGANTIGISSPDISSPSHNFKMDVTPILTTLADEMMEQSPPLLVPSTEKMDEKSIWTLLDYADPLKVSLSDIASTTKSVTSSSSVLTQQILSVSTSAEKVGSPPELSIPAAQQQLSPTDLSTKSKHSLHCMSPVSLVRQQSQQQSSFHHHADIKLESTCNSSLVKNPAYSSSSSMSTIVKSQPSQHAAAAGKSQFQQSGKQHGSPTSEPSQNEQNLTTTTTRVQHQNSLSAKLQPSSPQQSPPPPSSKQQQLIDSSSSLVSLKQQNLAAELLKTMSVKVKKEHDKSAAASKEDNKNTYLAEFQRYAASFFSQKLSQSQQQQQKKPSLLSASQQKNSESQSLKVTQHLSSAQQHISATTDISQQFHKGAHHKSQPGVQKQQHSPKSQQKSWSQCQQKTVSSHQSSLPKQSTHVSSILNPAKPHHHHHHHHHHPHHHSNLHQKPQSSLTTCGSFSPLVSHSKSISKQTTSNVHSSVALTFNSSRSAPPERTLTTNVSVNNSGKQLVTPQRSEDVNSSSSVVKHAGNTEQHARSHMFESSMDKKSSSGFKSHGLSGPLGTQVKIRPSQSRGPSTSQGKSIHWSIADTQASSSSQASSPVFSSIPLPKMTKSSAPGYQAITLSSLAKDSPTPLSVSHSAFQPGVNSKEGRYTTGSVAVTLSTHGHRGQHSSSLPQASPLMTQPKLGSPQQHSNSQQRIPLYKHKMAKLDNKKNKAPTFFTSVAYPDLTVLSNYFREFS